MKKAILVLYVCAFIFIFMSGCTTKAYKGDELSASETCKMTMPSEYIRYVREINGVRGAWAAEVSIPLGENSIKVEFDPGQYVTGASGLAGMQGASIVNIITELSYKDQKWDVKFTAIKGRKYTFGMSFPGSGNYEKVYPYVMDEKSFKGVSKAYRLN